jgi:HSP20 family protein
VNKDDLEVSASGHLLTIEGSTRHEQKEEKGDYYRRECSHGAFSRTVALPDDADSSKARAAFENGMLELVMPKTRISERRHITNA